MRRAVLTMFAMGLAGCGCESVGRHELPEASKFEPVAKLPPGPQRATDKPVNNTTLTFESDTQKTTFRWGDNAVTGASAAWTGENVLRGDAARREMGARAQIVNGTDTVAGNGGLTLTFTYSDGCSGRIWTVDGKDPEFEFRPAK